jgi:hypothetical protein
VCDRRPVYRASRLCICRNFGASHPQSHSTRFRTPFSPLRLLTRPADCTRALFRTARCIFKHTTILGVNGYFADNTGHMFAFKLPCKSGGRVQLQTLSVQIILYTLCIVLIFCNAKCAACKYESIELLL